jgi:hypothetical protein
VSHCPIGFYALSLSEFWEGIGSFVIDFAVRNDPPQIDEEMNGVILDFFLHEAALDFLVGSEK